MSRSDFKPHSCKHCARLVLDVSCITKKRGRCSQVGDLLLFPFTAADVDLAARDGCRLCKLIISDAAVCGGWPERDLDTWHLCAELARNGPNIRSILSFGLHRGSSGVTCRTRTGFTVCSVSGRF